MIIRTLRAILAAIVLFSAASLASAQRAAVSTDQLRQKLQTHIDGWHKTGKFPGATIGVCLANGNCFPLATGVSDLTSMAPMKPTDRMLAGSTGKTFAAAVAIQLVSEGKIGLDDKVAKYFGGESWFARLPNAKDITVRQLM